MINSNEVKTNTMKNSESELIKLEDNNNKMDNQNTMLIGEDWYYWNEDKEQWLPESYKFEETK